VPPIKTEVPSPSKTKKLMAMFAKKKSLFMQSKSFDFLKTCMYKRATKITAKEINQGSPNANEPP